MNTFEKNTANYVKSYNDKVKSKKRANLIEPVKKPQDFINDNFSMIVLLVIAFAVCFIIYSVGSLLEVI